MTSIAMPNNVKSVVCALILYGGIAPVGGLWTTAAAQDSELAEVTALVADVENFESQLADLESEFGPYHRSLLEPLNNLIELASGQGDFERVAELQSRQLQVVRTVMGFQHPDIKPLLQDIIRNEIRLQNWDAVSDHLEHLRYLEGGDGPSITPELLDVIEQQANWYMARVYLETPDRRGRNFMAARDLYSDLVDKAAELYGDESGEFIPWLYRHAMMEYRLVALMNAEGSVASDTIDRLVRAEGTARLQSFRRGGAGINNILRSGRYVPVVEEDQLIGELYLRDAWNAASKIGDIAAQQGNLEAQAMALIYEGDFQEIAGRSTSVRKYREAQSLLLEAGVSQSRIDQFFSQPMIIPMPDLFLTLDDALHFQTEARDEVGAGEDILHIGTLVEWQEDISGVHQPATGADYLGVGLSYNQVDASFSVSASGRISSVEVIEAIPPDRRVERHAIRALREIRVRPAVIEGRARRSRDVHIRYKFLDTD